MKWVKKGVIFAPDNNYEWLVSHASIPILDPIDDERFRIYFSGRDKEVRSFPGYIEVRADNLQDILYVHDAPVLPLGKLGTFDDSGIMASWLINHEGKKYLYYIGWNPQVTVSYRLSIGLAISEDGANHFVKYTEGPICDRSIDEPYFNTAPCVLHDRGIWKMWYVSCTKWEKINNHPEPFYNVKYAESKDGIHWQKTGRVCIDYDSFTDGIGRPCVIFDRGIYKMFYSYRSALDYRVGRERSYRLGYAESLDGITWERKDDEVGIERSNTGWDSEMMEYCYVYEHKGTKYMLYNGNGFGRTGFGYAVLEEE